MILEARAEGCFSTTHVLKLDDRPCGKFWGRFFSEGIDVQLTGRRHWRFDKVGWLSNQFVLRDADTGQEYARADRTAIFSSAWELELSIGKAEFIQAGWFDPAYEVRQQGNVHGRADRLGWCQRGWTVENLGALNETDLLLAGLVYHVIQLRQQQAAAAAGAHGS
jgi:hypothetical protein